MLTRPWYMYKYVSFLNFLLVYVFPQQPLLPLPKCPTFSTSFLILHDSDCGARVNSTCISWSFLEMKNPILIQTSWLSIRFEQDLLVNSFLSHRQCLMTHNPWFPWNILWQFEIELMNHSNPFCVWAWDSRKFCITYHLTDSYLYSANHAFTL